MIAFMKSRPLEVWTSNGKYRIDIGFDFTLRGESWARLYALHFSRHPDIFVWWLVAVACLKVRYPSLILLTSNVIASKASNEFEVCFFNIATSEIFGHCCLHESVRHFHIEYCRGANIQIMQLNPFQHVHGAICISVLAACDKLAISSSMQLTVAPCLDADDLMIPRSCV